MLVEDDLVHRVSEIEVDLFDEPNGVVGALAAQVLGSLSQLEHAVALVRIDLGDLKLWHVFNVVHILDQGVSVNAVLVSLLESTGKNSRVLLVEAEIGRAHV